MNEIDKKLNQLKEIIKAYGEVIVAFSGGIDSTFLTKIAFDVLKEKAVAVTLSTPQLPNNELIEAKELAEEIGIKHIIIDVKNNDYSWFENNPPDRCYICKKEALQAIKDFCKENNISGQILEGSNYDDLDDYRPGFKAVKEHEVKSPLVEAKLTKSEIRALAKKLDLVCWDKPASPCLATRFLFGEKITPEKMQMVYIAEKYLRELGIKQVRVRVHGVIARIETTEEFFGILIQSSKNIANELKSIGFEYVTMDLAGYKKGSMNKEK
ncbi:MAG: ATP-dependent sacrificial sulfur transferase LarE [Candidatus Thorarchaeota archaeon]